jgi:hypothetical protein
MKSTLLAFRARGQVSHPCTAQQAPDEVGIGGVTGLNALWGHRDTLQNAEKANVCHAASSNGTDGLGWTASKHLLQEGHGMTYRRPRIQLYALSVYAIKYRYKSMFQLSRLKTSVEHTAACPLKAGIVKSAETAVARERLCEHIHC